MNYQTIQRMNIEMERDSEIRYRELNSMEKRILFVPLEQRV